MISYPVDVVNSRWTVLQSSTGEIVGRNKKWPVADGGPIPGLDPDFVYLLQVDMGQPEYDSRLYTLQADDEIDVAGNTITRSWDAVKRAKDERKAAAENVEVQELSKHINFAREVIETRLIVTALLMFSKGLTLPPKVQAAATAYAEKGQKLWKNRDRLKAIIAAIEADTDPDLDAGWELP